MSSLAGLNFMFTKRESAVWKVQDGELVASRTFSSQVLLKYTQHLNTFFFNNSGHYLKSQLLYLDN